MCKLKHKLLGVTLILCTIVGNVSPILTSTSIPASTSPETPTTSPTKPSSTSSTTSSVLPTTPLTNSSSTLPSTLSVSPTAPPTKPSSTASSTSPETPTTSPTKPSSTSSSCSSSSKLSSTATATSTSTSSSSAQPSTPVILTPILGIDVFYNLTKEFWEWKLQDFPQSTSVIGINDDTASHLDKLSPQHFQQRRLKCEGFLQRAQKINSSAFPEEDLLNYVIFKEDLNTYVRNFKYLKYFLPVSTRDGPQYELKSMVKKHTVLKSLNDYQKLLSRYGEFPRQAQEILDIMKGHMVDGLMPSNWSLIGVTEKFDILQKPFNESVFYEPFLNIILNITTEQKETLQQQAKQRVQQDLLPSFKRIRDFIEMEYFPATRSEDGISSLPGGLDFYRACLKFHTNTDLTPQQIHDLGLSEVSRIKEEVSQTAVQLGMAGKSLSEISEIVKKDPNQTFSSKEELLNTYRNAVYNTIVPLMDQIVNNVPDANLTVEENSSGSSSYASYEGSPLDGSRPGTFYINAEIYEHHKRYEVNALSLHEAMPGHHLQFTILKMNPSIPEFRKFVNHYRYGDIPAKFPLHTAYSEGWGLYSEYLGNELGLYEDPYQRLGRHSFELLRACRLVVDTGLHVLGWTRQEAINYLLQNTAMAEEAIKIQIDRYITWPGQACAYKIGELKIKELRQKAETTLGNLFRLQDFHDVILGCVGPLNILEECVNSYILKNSS